MKKNIAALLCLFAFVAVFSTADGRVFSGEKKSIGYTIQDLSNPIWAQYAMGIEKLFQANGMTMTSLDCKANAATQITQVENFIQEGIDALIIHPAEANALEAVVGQARAAGIKVVSWDVLMKNADVGYLIDNYTAGRMIGEEAAKFINEKHGGRCQVAVLDYPVFPELVQRANGITDALAEYAPNAEIVARASAINATEGMAKAETVLLANPDIKVIACIGDGGAIGANEAAKAAGKDAPDFGIFSCDATEEALSKMANGESIRMSLSFGSTEVGAGQVVGLVMKLLNNEPIEKEFFRTPTAVTFANVGEFYKK